MENGGTEFSSLAFVLAAEELSRGDINTPTAVLATGLGLQPIIRFGTPEQRERFLRPFTDGDPRLAAFGFTEVTGGANVDSTDPKVGVQTFARLDGNEWVINGAKHYTANGTGWNRTGCAVPGVSHRPRRAAAGLAGGDRHRERDPGVEITGIIDTVGHRATISPRIELTDVRVPADNIIGKPGDGMEIVETSFSWTAAPIGAACVGRMRVAFDYAFEFAKTDSRSGPHPVIEYQNVGSSRRPALAFHAQGAASARGR